MFRGITHLRLTHNFPGVFTRDTRKCAVRLAHGACVRGQRKAEPWALCPQHTPEIFAVGLHLPCAAPQIAFLGSRKQMLSARTRALFSPSVPSGADTGRRSGAWALGLGCLGTPRLCYSPADPFVCQCLGFLIG